MKKNFVSVVLSLGVFNLMAQNYMATTTTSPGNILITHPGSLSVNGLQSMAHNVNTPSNSNSMILGSLTGVGFSNTISGLYGLYMGVSGTGNTWIQGGRSDGQAVPYDISFQAAGGNVGIGTTTPDYRLHIKDGVGGAQLKFQRGTGLATIVQDNNVNNLYLDAAAGLLLNTQVAGNVGIGITAPTDKLHIDGDIRLKGSSRKLIVGSEGSPNDYLLLQDVGSGTAALQWVQDGAAKFSIDGVTGNVGIGPASPLGKLHVADGNGGDQIRLSRGTGAVRFAQDMNQDNLYLFNNDGSKTYMYWRSDGNVGIGTMAPDAKLAVNGQVHATEVRVTTNVPGPDYVFEKDYKLTSLEEIKNYIDQNKHLPEIPSAKEMEKNGVQLGEMNMLLLKKIEELTLYVIDQNKKIDDLKNQNVETIKKNNELSVRVKKLEKKK
jgi:hypothetical protein